MLTTKKVIEDAIKVREEELYKLSLRKLNCQHYGWEDLLFTVVCEIENFESQIAELKQSLQIIYDANNNK